MDEPKLEDFLTELLRVREIKSNLQKDLKEVEEYLGELESEVLKSFDDMGLKSVKDDSGNNFSSVITRSARIEDPDAFFEYVVANNRVDLLHKRVIQSEVEKIWDVGEQVPGIEMITKIGLRIRKG